MQMELEPEQTDALNLSFVFNCQKTMFYLGASGYSKYVCKNFEGGSRDD